MPIQSSQLSGRPTRKVGLDWDSEKMMFAHAPEANEYLIPKFRKGWEVSLPKA